MKKGLQCSLKQDVCTDSRSTGHSRRINCNIITDMSDTDTLVRTISSAFVATLLANFHRYDMWHPFANKLREKSKKEVMQKEMIVEGILSITNGILADGESKN